MKSRWNWEPGDVIPVPDEDVEPVAVLLPRDEAQLLRGILADYAELFEDCDEEAERVALARRVAAVIEEALR